jgi:hypothetical protein
MQSDTTYVVKEIAFLSRSGFIRSRKLELAGNHYHVYTMTVAGSSVDAVSEGVEHGVYA